MGCGTGLCGKELKKYNFKNIHGVDVSQNMLDQAQPKGVYSSLTKYKLGQQNYLEHFP